MVTAQAYTTPPGTDIPGELRALDQWLAYRAVPKPDGKISKPPVDARTGRAGSSTDPATWSAYTVAAARSPIGAAFVLTADDPYVAIDLDNCVDDAGAIAPWAQAIIDRLPIYWEISFSRHGLRGIGRGVLPGERCRTGAIEIYDARRYVVMTGWTLPGHERIRSCQCALTTWYRELFPIEPPTTTTEQPSSRMFTDDDLVERLRRQRGIAGRLLDGDLCGKHSPSEARFALANAACFYTDDLGQLTRLVRTSLLWNDKDGERDRDRKAALDAREALRRYHGPRYDPDHGRTTTAPPPPAASEACAAERERIATLEAALAREHERSSAERERRIAAEHRADRLSFERSQLLQILRNPDLAAGPKLTHFATVLDLGARIANGEEQSPHGYRLPAKRVADMTGQKVAAVRSHWKAFAKAGLIDKVNVRERTERDGVDPETGEIITARGLRDVSHIKVPESDILRLITPALAYQKPEPETRGGRRIARCVDHPDAPTTTTHTTTCDTCGAVLDAYETHAQPSDSSGAFFVRETPVTDVYSAPVFAPEHATVAGRRTGANFAPDDGRATRVGWRSA